MTTADGVKAKIQGLIAGANEKTGKSDTNLTSAVNSLKEGYGQGGDPWDKEDYEITGDPIEDDEGDVTIPEGYIKPEGNLDITENGDYDVTYKKSVKVNVDAVGEVIPDGYIKPEGDLPISENGKFTVTDKDTVTVNVPIPNGYIKPEGNLSLTVNGDYDVTTKASVKVNVPIPDGYIQPEGNLPITQNGDFNVTSKASVSVNVPIPDGYIKPQGNLPITENGTFDVTEKSSVTVNVSSSGEDELQQLVYARGDYGAQYLFYHAEELTEARELDISKCTSTTYMFHSCKKLTHVPVYDTKNVTNVTYMFVGCSALTTVPAFDLRSATSLGSFLETSSQKGVSLTDIRVRNISSNFTCSYCTSVTQDSLIHLIYELRDVGSSKTFTMGTTNLAKISNVYVKLVPITSEMRAEDDLIDEKLPFVVCDSTDSGAMLITDYASSKNWVLK